MSDTLVRNAPPSSSVRTAGSIAGSNDGGAVRAVGDAFGKHRPDESPARTREGMGTPAQVGARAARHHSLIDLEQERNPSWETLLNERDPWPELYTPLTEYTAERIRHLVRERNGR
jgi:hypothetical protein